MDSAGTKNTRNFLGKLLKHSIVCFFILINGVIYCQEAVCNLVKSENNDIYEVEVDDLICLAKNTTKKQMFVYTFGIWCVPCRANVPNAIKLAEDYGLEMYVLLVDKEEEQALIANSIEYLKKLNPQINILLLSDRYGQRRNKKYKEFLKEITPPQFEINDGMSKFIVFDKTGSVVLITSWKDYIDKNEWRDNSKMIERTIIPILN